ncbi:unnamed protein product, partial [Staurois parvus]
ASVVRQAGSISIGQVGTGGASGDWSGSQARDQNRRSQQRFRSGRVSKGTETGCRTDTGPRTNTTPRQSLQVWPSLKYTSIISSRC